MKLRLTALLLVLILVSTIMVADSVEVRTSIDFDNTVVLVTLHIRCRRMLGRAKHKVILIKHERSLPRCALLIFEQQQPHRLQLLRQTLLPHRQVQRRIFVPELPDIRVFPQHEHRARFALNRTRVTQIRQKRLAIWIFTILTVQLRQAEDRNVERQGALF